MMTRLLAWEELRQVDTPQAGEVGGATRDKKDWVGRESVKELSETLRLQGQAWTVSQHVEEKGIQSCKDHQVSPVTLLHVCQVIAVTLSRHVSCLLLFSPQTCTGACFEPRVHVARFISLTQYGTRDRCHINTAHKRYSTFCVKHKYWFVSFSLTTTKRGTRLLPKISEVCYHKVSQSLFCITSSAACTCRLLPYLTPLCVFLQRVYY